MLRGSCSCCRARRQSGQRQAKAFPKDMHAIAKTADTDFEDFQLTAQKSVWQNEPTTPLLSPAKAEGSVVAQRTLQHVLTQTATVAFPKARVSRCLAWKPCVEANISPALFRQVFCAGLVVRSGCPVQAWWATACHENPSTDNRSGTGSSNTFWLMYGRETCG